MADITKIQAEKTKANESDDTERPMTTGEESPKENFLETSGKFREASYVVLFIAAVFVVNAMETGSYRTPWPVAIITALAGLGIFGYSWYLRAKAKEE